MSKIKNLKGQRFGRLLVIGDSGKRIYRGVAWNCLCNCGNFKMVRSNELISKNTRSCGCLRGEARIKHGDSHGIRLYGIWMNMKRRCNNKNNGNFKYYGGRGIKVCAEWEEYILFRKWALNNGYADNLTIDRIDNDKNYYPANCQWLTLSENSRKKSK